MIARVVIETLQIKVLLSTVTVHDLLRVFHISINYESHLNVFFVCTYRQASSIHLSHWSGERVLNYQWIYVMHRRWC